jgi:hypothetical protein
MILTLPLTVSRTCDALAAPEGHTLHAVGERELVDGACERKGEEREKEKVRKEEVRASGRQNVLNKYDHSS